MVRFKVLQDQQELHVYLFFPFCVVKGNVKWDIYLVRPNQRHYGAKILEHLLGQIKRPTWPPHEKF